MMVEVTGLTFSYPQSDFSVEIPAFSMEAGEAVALVGPSGCGKTTFLELVAGILIADAGSISVDGCEGEGEFFRLSTMGLVFQQFELIPYLTLRENIELPLTLGVAGDFVGRCDELASRMGIESLLERLPDRVSQGECQRAAICRALMVRPGLVLADEPTGNLDPLRKQEAMNLLLDQAKREGAAVLVVTHDRGVLEGFDRVEDFQELNRKGAL